MRGKTRKRTFSFGPWGSLRWTGTLMAPQRALRSSRQRSSGAAAAGAAARRASIKPESATRAVIRPPYSCSPAFASACASARRDYGAGVRSRTARPPSRPRILAVAFGRDGHATRSTPLRLPETRSRAR